MTVTYYYVVTKAGDIVSRHFSAEGARRGLRRGLRVVRVEGPRVRGRIAL